MNIVIFGAPGAGKGTQSAELVAKLGMFHISTGDLFRAAFKNETELGKKAKEYVNRGSLVPDDITIKMVEEVFENIGEKDFILDGFPRNTAQAEALGEMLSKIHKSVDKAVFLHVPREQLMSRLTGRRLCKDCGAVYHMQAKLPKQAGKCDACQGANLYQRDDDKKDVIANRLEAYDANTAPLIEYYKKAGKYVEVDGVGDTGEIFSRLKSVLQG